MKRSAAAPAPCKRQQAAHASPAHRASTVQTATDVDGLPKAYSTTQVAWAKKCAQPLLSRRCERHCEAVDHISEAATHIISRKGK